MEKQQKIVQGGVAAAAAAATQGGFSLKTFLNIQQQEQQTTQKRIPSTDNRMGQQTYKANSNLQQITASVINGGGVHRSMNLGGVSEDQQQKLQALQAASMLMNAHAASTAAGGAAQAANKVAQGSQMMATTTSRNQQMTGDSYSLQQQVVAKPQSGAGGGAGVMMKRSRRYLSTEKYVAGNQGPAVTTRGPAAGGALAQNMHLVQQQYMAKGAPGAMQYGGADDLQATHYAAQQQRQKSGDYRHSQGAGVMNEQSNGLRTVIHTTDEDEGMTLTRTDATIASTPPKEDPTKIIKFGQTKFSDYSKVCVLGRGTYGEVTRCVHIPSGLEVAMKTFFFENVQNGINYSTMREISILKSLSDQPYFVKILDVIKDDTHKDKIIYCIFEYCSSTLGKFFMKQHKPIPLERIQSMMKQLLSAVDIMHGKMILHRDIKPDNILLDKQGNIKVADFGLAKKASFMQRRKSNTIVSLWYRAPEIILGSEDYLLGVDIWSMGCIFAEFFTLKPVFQAKNETDALDRAFRILGYPTNTHSAHLLELAKLKLFPQLVHHNIQSLSASFPMIDNPLALDLLNKLLALDPRDRITAKEALRHDFFKPISRKQEMMMSMTSKHSFKKQQNNIIGGGQQIKM